MAVSVRATNTGQARGSRGFNLTITAVEGDTLVFGFIHSAGTYQYMNYDGSPCPTVVSPCGTQHFGIVSNATAGVHTFYAYTDNGGHVIEAIWALSNANMGPGVHDSDTDFEQLNDMDTHITLTTEPYGIVLVLGAIWEHAYSWGWVHSVVDTLTWHETDDSPWPTLMAGYKLAEAGSTTQVGMSSDVTAYYVEIMRLSAISIRGAHAYTQAAGGGITPTNDPGNPGRIATGPGHQNFYGGLEPAGSLTIWISTVQHLHAQDRPLGVTANERDFHLHSEGRSIASYDDQ